MKRSRLKNKANKSTIEEDEPNVSKLNNKMKKAYFKEKLSKRNNVKDFKNYCKIYFTNKGIDNDERIVLFGKDEIDIS